MDPNTGWRLSLPSSGTCQIESIHRSPALSPLQGLPTTTFPWHAHGPQPVSRCSHILESSHRHSSPEVLTLHPSPPEVPPASGSLLGSLFQSFHWDLAYIPLNVGFQDSTEPETPWGRIWVLVFYSLGIVPGTQESSMISGKLTKMKASLGLFGR